MNTRTSKPLAVGLAAAIALGSGIATSMSGSANAAPLAANQLAVKDAATDNVINVGRRHRGSAAFAGLALGVIGAIIAHEVYRKHRNRQRDHYYSYGYAPYGYAPYPYHVYPHRSYKSYHYHNHHHGRRSGVMAHDG
jgi:hypothetical protein